MASIIFTCTHFELSLFSFCFSFGCLLSQEMLRQRRVLKPRIVGFFFLCCMHTSSYFSLTIDFYRWKFLSFKYYLCTTVIWYYSAFMICLSKYFYFLFLKLSSLIPKQHEKRQTLTRYKPFRFCSPGVLGYSSRYFLKIQFCSFIF